MDSLRAAQNYASQKAGGTADGRDGGSAGGGGDGGGSLLLSQLEQQVVVTWCSYISLVT